MNKLNFSRLITFMLLIAHGICLIDIIKNDFFYNNNIKLFLIISVLLYMVFITRYNRSNFYIIIVLYTMIIVSYFFVNDHLKPILFGSLITQYVNILLIFIFKIFKRKN